MSEPSVPVSSPAASDLELRKTEAIRKLAAHLPDHDDADFIRLKKLAIVEKLLASFDESNMSPFFLDEIESFHSHPPLRPAPAFLDDVNQRLQLLREIQSTKMKRQNSSRPWQCLPVGYITANVWAVFFAAPIEALQGLLRRMRNGDQPYDHLFDILVFMEDHLPAVIQSSGQSSKRNIISSSYSFRTNKKRGLIGPIWCLGAIWGRDLIERYLQQREEHNHNKPSNMISFSHISQNHHSWGKARFAFEPISQPNSRTIRIRLHLLQNTNLRYPFLVHRKETDKRQDTSWWWNDLATDPRKFLDPFVNDKFVTEGPLEIRVGSSVTQHIVRDGYVFDITSEDPVPLPSYDVLDVQYRIELMRALIGAGKGSDDVVSRSATEWEDDLSVASGYSHEDF